MTSAYKQQIYLFSSFVHTTQAAKRRDFNVHILFNLYFYRRSMDIALLNLANVLHRSHHSEDALVPLQVAVTLAPDVNVLHYTLGNIYAVSIG